MTGGRDNKNRRGGRPGRPERRGGDAPRSGRGDRPERRSSDRDGRENGERPPRPPIKGRRRTFDIDSDPNATERRRLEDPDAAPTSEPAWVDEGPVRRAADGAVRRGRTSGPGAMGSGAKGSDGRGSDGRGSSGRRAKQSSGGRNDKRRAQRAAKRAEGALEIDRSRLVSSIGATRANRTIERLGEASDAFANERFEDARRILKPLVDLVPNEAVLRELYGLSLYRLGKWKQAAAELEEFARRTGSTEQHPVLADCLRAMGQHERVAELWDELGQASPEASIIAEGRIVYAGSLADQGDVPGAIAALEAGSLGRGGSLRFHHLRMRYALADLYDRAGEQQSARRQFAAIADTDPDFFDVRDRLRQL